MYPIYRQPATTPSPYPENVCRTMAPQVYQYRRVIGHHFKNRRNGSSPANVRNWIAAFRRDLRACGWSTYAAQVNAKESTK